MAERWRLVVDDRATDTFGLAADEYLMGAATGPRGDVAATLRLYTYRSHSALVGRFQDAAAEVRLDECERLGIAVNRRPTGGGAILMGQDQLGVALTMPPRYRGLPERPGPLFQRLAEGLCKGLTELGVDAGFRPKNDLEAHGRKVAGLGICRGAGGGLLFHASLLVDLDTALMLRVLPIPSEKHSDKLLRYVADRTTTVRREADRAVTLDETRAAVADGYARAFGAELVEESFTEGERRAIQALVDSRYGTDEWVFQRRPAASDGDPRETSRSALGGACFGPRTAGFGTAVCKTPAGLLRVYVSLAGPETIKSVLVTGDFFADAAGLARLEARLKWASADPASIRGAVLAEVSAASMSFLEPGALVEAITRAIVNARQDSPMRRVA